MSQAFIPPDVGDDAHIIRRLGWALVRNWSDLPDEWKDRLLNFAGDVHDRHLTVQLRQQIEIFLGRHGGNFDDA